MRHLNILIRSFDSFVQKSVYKTKPVRYLGKTRLKVKKCG